MLHNPLSNMLSKIKQYDRMGKTACYVRPASRLMKQVLTLMHEHGYIGAVEEVETARGGMLKVNLLGNINGCGVITPRFAVKTEDFVKFEKRYLPANDFGFVIVSTSNGVMTHKDAKTKGIGGRLLSYCY